MKQQAPKTLPQKAETIENTRKTADILIGAACHKKLRNLLISELFLALFWLKSSTIFLKMRFDPNRDPNRDVRRCTKQYEIAQKDHSAAHKTYIKSVFFHEKRGALPFWQRARYALRHTTSRPII
jgi:hypothetical protein